MLQVLTPGAHWFAAAGHAQHGGRLRVVPRHPATPGDVGIDPRRGAVRRARRVSRLAKREVRRRPVGGLLSGVIAALSFYALAPLGGYNMMLVSWVLLWVMLAALQTYLDGRLDLAKAVGRGLVTSIAAAVGFAVVLFQLYRAGRPKPSRFSAISWPGRWRICPGCIVLLKRYDAHVTGCICQGKHLVGYTGARNSADATTLPRTRSGSSSGSSLGTEPPRNKPAPAAQHASHLQRRRPAARHPSRHCRIARGPGLRRRRTERAGQAVLRHVP